MAVWRRIRRDLAWKLRMLGDRVDPGSGPRAMSYSFTFEPYKGMVLREGTRQGCPLWFMEEDYDRAHDEADGRHPVVDWARLAGGGPGPYVRDRGGNGDG